MKNKKDALELREAAAPLSEAAEAMIRTQVYLTRSEHSFLQSEALRRNEPMAAVLRSFIDEKMRIPDEAWTKNPLLEPTVNDPEYSGRKDGSINHDYYIYGGSRKYRKAKEGWVEKAENEP